MHLDADAFFASVEQALDPSLKGKPVVTGAERGIVYMLGRVTQREGQRAAQIASGVSGVNKVVTLFEYISEEELKDYQRKPASENKATS
jgi:hypothetical protein